MKRGMKRGTKRGLLNVRSGSTAAERLAFYSRKQKDGCLLWVGTLDRLGYARMMIGGRCRQVHRVAWETANGEIPPGLKVLHKCDVRHCINPDHLLLGTQRENLHDMTIKGRRATKLTVDVVRKIRSARGTPAEIARRFKISESHVYGIRSRERWAHV